MAASIVKPTYQTGTDFNTTSITRSPASAALLTERSTSFYNPGRTLRPITPFFGQVENDRNSQQPSSSLLPSAGPVHSSDYSLAKLYKYIARVCFDKTWTAVNLHKRRANLSIAGNLPLDIVVGRLTHAPITTRAAAPSRFTTAARARTRATTPVAALNRQRARRNCAGYAKRNSLAISFLWVRARPRGPIGESSEVANSYPRRKDQPLSVQLLFIQVPRDRQRRSREQPAVHRHHNS